MTSAGVKTSFAYDLLIDDFIDSIIHPKSTFVFGCDYRVPVIHGLLDKTYINKLKTSSSFILRHLETTFISNTSSNTLSK